MLRSLREIGGRIGRFKGGVGDGATIATAVHNSKKGGSPMLKHLKVATVALLMMALLVTVPGTVATAQTSGCIVTPFGTFCFGNPGGGSGNTCPGLPFPLPNFPGLNCGHFQGGAIQGISASIHFYSPSGPTMITVPYGTTGIRIFIANLPINRPVTILLADSINGRFPQIYNLSGFYPSGQAVVNAYAGERGVEFIIAWVDVNGNGVVDLGELTIPFLTMFVM